MISVFNCKTTHCFYFVLCFKRFVLKVFCFSYIFNCKTTHCFHFVLFLKDLYWKQWKQCITLQLKANIRNANRKRLLRPIRPYVLLVFFFEFLTLLCAKLCIGCSIWGQLYYQLRKKCLLLWIVSKSSMMISWNNMMTTEVIQGCNEIVQKVQSIPSKNIPSLNLSFFFFSIYHWQSSMYI